MSNKIEKGIEVYQKVGRRYKKLGLEFKGWPANGVWLVHDGYQSKITYIGAVPDPMPVAQLARHETAACTAIRFCLDEHRRGKPMSTFDYWRAILDAISADTEPRW